MIKYGTVEIDLVAYRELIPILVTQLEHLITTWEVQGTIDHINRLNLKNMDPSDDWFDSEDADWVCEELLKIMKDYAPDGMFFGAKNGFGYGFWFK